MIKLIAFVKSNFTLFLSAIVLILFFTGNLTGVTTLAQSAFLKTGMMDASADSKVDAESFDFNFSVTDLRGNVVQINQYKGKVIFINLWATWCGPCRAEMPTIQELYNTVDHDKIVFILLSLDKASDQNKVINFIKKKEFTFPVFLPASQLTEQLNVPSIPTTFVISKAGNIVSRDIGTTNFNTKKFKKFLQSEIDK